MKHQLQYISQESEHCSHVEAILEACRAGCKWIQLRIKDKPSEKILAIGKEVRSICDRHQATFILNDYLDLVEEIGADGVHLGKSDAAHALARRQLGPNYIIGGTANTIEDVLGYAREGAVNYVGVGPFRYTTTKKNLSPVLGLDGYRRIVNQSRQEGVAMPLVAIGGILFEDISAILDTGVGGIAVSGLITHAADKSGLVSKIYQLIAEKLAPVQNLV